MVIRKITIFLTQIFRALICEVVVSVEHKYDGFLQIALSHMVLKSSTRTLLFKCDQINQQEKPRICVCRPLYKEAPVNAASKNVCISQIEILIGKHTCSGYWDMVPCCTAAKARLVSPLLYILLGKMEAPQELLGRKWGTSEGSATWALQSPHEMLWTTAGLGQEGVVIFHVHYLFLVLAIFQNHL